MVQDIDAKINFTIPGTLMELIAVIFMFLITGTVILSIDPETAWQFILDLIHILQMWFWQIRDNPYLAK